MRAILVLYMVAPAAAGGLGFENSVATNIYGTYTMMVYLASIPGGFLADRFLGTKKAVLLGGIIIALGHFTLAFPSLSFFYGGLALIVIGTGCLKPNISTMLGSLYGGPEDHRRDGGFSIFYMGINIGAAISPIVCGFLAQSKQFKDWLSSQGLDPASSWHWGFAAAGVGMTIGLLHLLAQSKRLKGIGEKPAGKTTKAPDSEAPSGALTKEEWKRIGAIAILFFFTMMFWAVYEQGGSSLSLFAEQLTRNEIFGFEFPSSWLQSLQAVFVIILAPFFSWLWVKLGDKEPSSPAKFAFGLLFLGLGILLMVPASALAAQGKISPLWLCAVYFLEVVGELCLSPVGLSTVTKLAPLRFASMTMGLWFVAAALGNKTAGLLAGHFEASDPQKLISLFGGMAAAVFAGAIVLTILRPTVSRLMGSVR